MGEVSTSKCSGRSGEGAMRHRRPSGGVKPTWMVAIAIAAVMDLACSSTGQLPVHPPAEAETRFLRGKVEYEARRPTERGISLATQVRPARYVAVELRTPDGTIVERTRADGQGRFKVAAPPGTAFIVAIAAVEKPRIHACVSSRDLCAFAYELKQPVRPGASQVTLLADDDGVEGLGGAFHILDTMLLGLSKAQEWGADPLPTLVARWKRGWPQRTGYRAGATTLRPGPSVLGISGGDAADVARSESDEHDESAVLHEVAHFLFDHVSTCSSRGGSGVRFDLSDPGYAWEEGRATWFAAVARGDPHYRDAAGREPSGKLLIERDLEKRSAGTRGAGSIRGVEEALWDLSDGAEGLEDRDSDGVSIGPARVFQEMMRLREHPGAYPDLSWFLGFLADRQVVERSRLRRMLVGGDQPAGLVPDAGERPWPSDLTVPGAVEGRLGCELPLRVRDGGEILQVGEGEHRYPPGVARDLLRGMRWRWDGVDVFRFHLASPATVRLGLEIVPSDSDASRIDADLELRDIRSRLLRASEAAGGPESLEAPLREGWYIVAVRDSGYGGCMDYRLSAEIVAPAP